jgi:hypothetical protein
MRRGVCGLTVVMQQHFTDSCLQVLAPCRKVRGIRIRELWTHSNSGPYTKADQQSHPQPLSSHKVCVLCLFPRALADEGEHCKQSLRRSSLPTFFTPLAHHAPQRTAHHLCHEPRIDPPLARDGLTGRHFLGAKPAPEKRRVALRSCRQAPERKRDPASVPARPQPGAYQHTARSGLLSVPSRPRSDARGDEGCSCTRRR